MPTRTQTEATLADLAIGIVSEKLPELLNHLIGFELLNSNTDRTKAAGILGFKVGEELLYMPVLFLSGKPIPMSKPRCIYAEPCDEGKPSHGVGISSPPAPFARRRLSPLPLTVSNPVALAQDSTKRTRRAASF